MNKGFGKEIVKELIEKIKAINGREIIVQAELENKSSNGVLIANGFVYDNKREYYRKEI